MSLGSTYYLLPTRYYLVLGWQAVAEFLPITLIHVAPANIIHIPRQHGGQHGRHHGAGCRAFSGAYMHSNVLGLCYGCLGLTLASNLESSKAPS